MGQVWEGTSPRWAGAPPHQGPRRKGRGKGANPKGRWALGPMPGVPPSPPPPGRHPDGIWGLPPPLGEGTQEGEHPPPLSL